MIEIVAPGNSQLALVTLALGGTYLKSWQSYALPNWKLYCERNGLGLYLETNDRDQDIVPKKKQWQKMLLGEEVKRLNPNVRSLCYLDTDILVNPFAPNVFDYHKSGTVGLVSKFESLPYDRMTCLRRIAFLRRRYISDNYPLDSALFLDKDRLFTYQDLPIQFDYACTGLLLFDIGPVSEHLESVFSKYKMPIKSITDGGEEAHLNYEIQNNFNINWLDYRFQTFWTYEMSWKYPFLYRQNSDLELVGNCIKASLWGTYFLHFAGSWNEGDHWENPFHANDVDWNKMLSDFDEYLKIPITGDPVGKITRKSG
jgi:hypothetical protein